MALPQIAMNFMGNLKDLQTLYEDPIFSLGILRLLDPLTKRLVFSLLCENLCINSLREVENIKESLSALVSLSMIKKAGSKVLLNDKFRQSVLEGFTMKSVEKAFIYTTDSTKDEANIRSSSDRKYRMILESITSSVFTVAGVREILLFCNLVDAQGQITNQGFEFLLKNRSNQLWHVLIHSIRYFAENSLEEAGMLLNLLEIVNKNRIGLFSCNILNKRYESWYSFLDSIGIFHIVSSDKKSQSMKLYINNSDIFDKATKADLQQAQESPESKYLVLETNFKIYAYATKSYERSILELFSKVVCVFPDMIKAYLDEESVLAALKKGITAHQLVKYMKEYSANVPNNVINQIEIWEKKQHRLKLSNGYLYHDFIHFSDYKKVLKYIETKNSLIFKDEQRRLIVAEEWSHKDVKEFIKSLS